MASTGLTHATVVEGGGAWVNFSNLTVDDTAVAQSADADEYIKTFKNAGETSSLLDLLPTDLTSIDGIEVTIRMYDVFGDQDTAMDVQLSWDGDSTYTSKKTTAQPNHATPAQDYVLGGPTDTWGRTWSRSEFADSLFYLNIGANGGFPDELRVEFVEVEVYYTEAAGPSAPDVHTINHVGFVLPF